MTHQVIAPLSRGPSTGGHSTNPFEVVGFPATTPRAVHNVCLDVLPSLDTCQRSELNWTFLHTSLQFSDRERKVRETIQCTRMPASEVFVSLKDTLHMIFGHVTGVSHDNTPKRVVQLSAPGIGIFMILFVVNVRLDLSSFTIVADVAAVHLDMKDMMQLGQGIVALQQQLDRRLGATILVTEPEALAWRKLLPAYVERCRTWSHGRNCEYRTGGGHIPLRWQLAMSPPDPSPYSPRASTPESDAH
jgi:hypothetical protein